MRLTWLLAVLGVVTAVPLFVPHYLPFTDLPEHEAVMSALAHWNDPSMRIATTYTLVLGKSQYLLYHVVGAALTVLLGDADLANRALLAGVAMAMPFSFRALLRAYERPEYLAVFAPMIFWNRALQVGFLPYCASIPLLLFGLALVVRRAKLGTDARWPRDAGLALLGVVLFYVHVSAYVIFLASAGLLTARELVLAASARGEAQSVRLLVTRGVRTLAWLVPSVMAAVYWWTAGKITVQGESLSQDGAIGSMRLTRAIHAFPLWTHDVFKGHGDEWCAAGFWIAFIALLLAPVAKSDAAPAAPSAAPETRAVALVRRVAAPLLPLACVIALYLSTPYRVGAGSMLNVRLAPILSLFVIGALRAPPPSTWITRGAVALTSLATLGMSVNAARVMSTMNRQEMGDVRAMFAKAAPGKRVAIVNFVTDSPHTHFPPWAHVGAYYRVDRGGLVEFSFTALHHWPLHYRDEAKPPPSAIKHPFWEFDPCVFRNEEDGAFYDYLFVRGGDPFKDEPPGPKWRAIAREKSFTLYERTTERYPAWPFPDEGPCVSYTDAEKHAADRADRREAEGETSPDAGAPEAGIIER